MVLIPPATIATADGDDPPVASPQRRETLEELGSPLPPSGECRRIIEIVPEGTFVTYGLGVPLSKMRDPVAARARVHV